jgi:predicted transcriptional regulator
VAQKIVERKEKCFSYVTCNFLVSSVSSYPHTPSFLKKTVCFFNTHKLLNPNFAFTKLINMASKLERYVEILKVLDQKGPLELSHIEHEANLACIALQRCLDFLMKQGLVQERMVKKNHNVYVNTGRGTKVIEFFTQNVKKMPSKEENKTLQAAYGQD